MKIAILTPTFSKFSGPDRVAEHEAEELAKNNEVTVFAFKGDIKPKKARLVLLGAPKNATLERLYKFLFFLDLCKVSKCTRRIAKYDLVISFMYPMTIMGCLAKRFHGKKYVYYNMGIAYPELFSSAFERFSIRVFSVMTKLTVRNADYAISISDFLRKDLKKDVGLGGKVRYVTIDKKRFNMKVNKRKISEVKKKYNLKGPVCLYVGRISPHKGVHLLIKAFEKVNEKIPNAKLLIVGKHTFDKYSKKLRTSNKNIIFTGFVADEELPFYYGASDLYTTATLWEGFDMPAVEAQACGKKVVAFDIGSHPEVVKKGILVKKGDVDGFADAIVKNLKKSL
ncbi:MAG: glycosyltransferase family 4 protein [bacterium]|nr:glycosyltransferase family 4 protein [bacterium]